VLVPRGRASTGWPGTANAARPVPITVTHRPRGRRCRGL